MNFQFIRLMLVVSWFGMVGPLRAEGVVPKQEILLAKPVTLADSQIVAKVIRIEFPAGFKTPRHIHEGPGPRYVLAGKVKVIDKDGARVYHPGEVFWETGEAMVVENVADDMTALLIFEMAPLNTSRQTNRIVIKPNEKP